MSGTSLDGVDGVLARFPGQRCDVAHHATAPLPQDLRAELLALNTRGDDELHRAALAGNALMRCYAGVVAQLLRQSGLPATQIQALGAHGQTVRHRPQAFDGTGYTLQLGNPALLAELTAITVVADLRSRDVAAGGQGAPLVPAFHQRIFGRADRCTAVLNLGGIANLSILATDGAVLGFDCGPANALLDYWCQQHTGAPYDAAGAWAAGGRVLPELLAALMTEPFLAQQPPKSTGRDLFNPSWLAPHLQHAANASAQDIHATLTEFTAHCCSQDVLRHAAQCPLLIVCGGGAYNTYLMQRLQALLPGVRVEGSGSHGLPPQQVEAAAFAWLARECLSCVSANLPAVTGARGPRILGAIYQA